MEIVKSIKEIFNYCPNSDYRWSRYDGYEVETDQHVYRLLIDNGTCCCEDWGYFATNDDVDRFVGKGLQEVLLTDEALDQKKVDEYAGTLDEGGIMFVDFVFADGDKLQLAVYNAHNGYYGHGIILMKDDSKVMEDCL